jgi:hypothetical protein
MENDYNSSPTVTDCTFTGNSANVYRSSNFGGGGMLNFSYSSPTITNCTFTGNSANEGGGMANWSNSNPTITNCTFTGNSAEFDGGGMLNYNSSNPTVTNCTFTGNSAEFDGGGMLNYNSSSPTVTNCMFTSNSASASAGGGGGVFIGLGSPVFVNCTFVENFAQDSGGAMHNVESTSTLTNCLFIGNTALGDGGGVFNNQSSPVVTNCTFSSNRADWLGGGISSEATSNPIVTNCILWGNTALTGSQINDLWPSSTTVTYSDVQGGWPGTGNINADPVFVDANNDDYHLLPTSPCIDAGMDAGVYDDIEGNMRPYDYPGVDNNGGLPEFDMGAYETILEVPMKLTPKALNVGSQGRWVKAHFVLPESYDVNDVDVSRPAVIEPSGILSDNIKVSVNEAGLVEVVASFDRQVFCGLASLENPLEITVTGFLKTGQSFYGTDTIKVSINNLEYVVILASYWLQGGCSAPGWCGGADADQNSVVNLVDFALFNGCCIEVVK